MPWRVTMERLLRDDDDDSGQSIRNWHLRREGGHITIRLREGSSGDFIMLRIDDVPAFVSDLEDLSDFEPDDDPKPKKGKAGK
jgi:hypothetical protein